MQTQERAKEHELGNLLLLATSAGQKPARPVPRHRDLATAPEPCGTLPECPQQGLAQDRFGGTGHSAPASGMSSCSLRTTPLRPICQCLARTRRGYYIDWACHVPSSTATSVGVATSTNHPYASRNPTLLKAATRNGKAALPLPSATKTTIKARSKFLVLKVRETAKDAASAKVTIINW